MRLVLLIALPIAAAIAVFFAMRGGDTVETPVAEQAPVSIYQRVCLQCHGAAGEGNAELKTPSIAGQPAWYLEVQLEKFRRGWRGARARDELGQQMRAIALSLREEEIGEVIATVVSFPKQATEATFTGDVVAGRVIFEEQCMECHRYNGSGEKVFGSSPLTAFQDWYIAAQLEKFRNGVRGYHKDDEKGQQMKHLISYLSEKDVRDVSAYIATLAKRYPPRER